MIIATDEPLSIGQHVTKYPEGWWLTDNKGDEHVDQPFIVLRTATLEEYLDDAYGDGSGPSRFVNTDKYFYEVSVD